MPLQATSGAASYDAFGGGVPFEPTYIEQIFQTWLYTGTGAAQTITNGIDLAGKGGLVWVKVRTNAFADHALSDTVNGTGKYLSSNTDLAQTTTGSNLTAFNADGFTVGTRSEFNKSGDNLASWTFRKQPKFFDVVTWTGNTTSGRQIPHSLGSVPGCIIIKRTSGVSEWQIWHKDTYDTNFNGFNTSEWGNGGPSPAYGGTGSGTALGAQLVQSTSTVFQVDNAFATNRAGETYVAYLFAHNAGGFGLEGTDNVISCGSFTTDSGGSATINLGYEPQWVLTKLATGAQSWFITDTMRGYTANYSNNAVLFPNLSDAETANLPRNGSLTSTGFQYNGAGVSNGTYIYIAIRRGPMKVPTTGTSVFKPAIRTGTGTTATVTGVGFPLDVVITNTRNYPGGAGHVGQFWDRLRGAGKFLRTPFTDAEGTVANAGVLGQDGYTVSDSSGGQNGNGEPFVDYSFRRAPGFFDEVCYTGSSVARTVAHNLAAVPELMIVKRRSTERNWNVYAKPLGATKYVTLNLTDPVDTWSVMWNDTEPTSSVFTVGIGNSASAETYVAYLFASAPGVSKVGSYTGNGTTQAIACGFTGGARFILIKRTNSTGDWYVWDTARGIVAGNDPHLSLNTTAAEVTSNDTIDTDSTGFVVNQVAATNVNVNAATYIFLAIA
jgi:hypothetical protein